jgi:hypothetical protein
VGCRPAPAAIYFTAQTTLVVLSYFGRPAKTHCNGLQVARMCHSTRSFAFAASIDCHCMLPGESAAALQREHVIDDIGGHVRVGRPMDGRGATG